jgi:hypothetical protein
MNCRWSHIYAYIQGILVRDCSLPFENYGHVFLNEPAPVLSYRVL